MDKKDAIVFFQELRFLLGDDFHNNVDNMNQACSLFENYNIGKLDIKRLYRYLDNNTKKTQVDEDIDEVI